MSEAIRAEITLLTGSLAVGLGLMAVYDGLRIFRVLVPHGMLWTGLEDVLYWLCSGISTFLLLFYQNDGILRWYAVCGVLAGMFLYNMTVSRILLRVLKKAEKYLTIKKRKRKLRAAQRQEKKRRKAEERRQKNGESIDGRSTTNAGKRTGRKKEKRKSE